MAREATKSVPTELQQFLSDAKTVVDARLPALLEKGMDAAGHDPLDPLPPAVREGLLSPGKRVRPALVFLSGELFGVRRERLLDAACAVEMVHAASLVLDDLPAMDDAVTRRGRPALHVGHGEDVAVLAAVTLVTRAFGLLAESGLRPGGSEKGIGLTAALDLVSRLADACGLKGLSSGQALDLRAAGADATFDRLETIHARKTGALFVACAEFGAVVGGARERELAAVRSYARNLGLAFQIVDDLLERIPSAATGKESRRAPAPTFAGHVGEEGARLLVGELTAHAVEAIAPFGSRGRLLADFAALLRDRTS